MKFTSCRGLLNDRKTRRRTLPSGQTHFTCAVKSEGPTWRRCATPFCVRLVCWLLVVKRTQRYLFSSAGYLHQAGKRNSKTGFGRGWENVAVPKWQNPS